MKRSEWLAVLVAAAVLMGGASQGAAEDPNAARFQTSVELE